MIQEFKAQVAASGLARSNKWIIQVHPPRGLTASGRALGGLLGDFNINLPILDALDETVGALNDIDINLGGVNVNFNPNIPTLGFSLSGENEGLRKINMFTSEVSIPARDVAEVIRKTEGEQRAMGFKHIQNNLEVQYYCSESLAERKFFEDWQDIVYSRDGVSTGYYDDYTSRIEVFKMNASMNKKVAHYQFNEAYCSNVAELGLNNDMDILKLGISFKFRNYERID